ncbi:mannose-1-phosphate guanylyltransferase [candidate division NPL-UPA2 bacterium Unc8]|uniref:mannose-1-phosphate guanylyltransferase n=1 Tax=candidate division NPL-UPA2 bacterium Unc8 TaxID=1980939 RepID=A0A399FXC6_UNCN2|nr:MAG: mannose-1-phosphate guanylyltransferase [candidate division NPL-UPA2 bacterium Unc8]
MDNLVAVIMAGGKGERFWPRSRGLYPKQLLPITGRRTMIQETAKRMNPLISSDDIFVVAGEELAGGIGEQLPELRRGNLILEPFGKNTAAAIGLAAIVIEKINKKAIMVVLAADHLIGEKRKFLRTISMATKAAKEGKLVTLGIQPTRPETGYGYIESGKKLQISGVRKEAEIYAVKRFVEKPDEAGAKKYLQSGKYFWNSGMFIWKVESILGAIEEHMPELHRGLKKISAARGVSHKKEVIKKVYKKLENISIDYGIVEKSKNIAVVKADFHWDDVGSWLSMERIHKKNKDGNIIQGKFVGIDTSQCILIGKEQLIATVGVSGLIVVTTPQAVLICSRDRAQDVKKIVGKLADDGLKKYL